VGGQLFGPPAHIDRPRAVDNSCPAPADPDSKGLARSSNKKHEIAARLWTDVARSRCRHTGWWRPQSLLVGGATGRGACKFNWSSLGLHRVILRAGSRGLLRNIVGSHAARNLSSRVFPPAHACPPADGWMLSCPCALDWHWCVRQCTALP